MGLSKKKIFLLGLMLAFLAYGAGAATVKYNLFPYPWIKLMIRGGNPLPKALLQGQPLVAALKKGGYTIFFRHARKRNGQPSPLNFNLFDSVALLTKRAPQHPFLENLCLSDQGKAESWVIGMAFKELGIPLGRIYSSPSCRCRETVEIAFGRVDGLEPSLMYSGIQLEDERSEMETKLHTLLSERPEAGTNTVLSSHQAVALGLFGVSPQEADAIIFQTLSSGEIRFVAQVSPLDWVQLMERSELLSSTRK